jgi:hypothetical protein
MVIVANIYLRFYIEVGVDTFLQTPTPAKIPPNTDSTALIMGLSSGNQKQHSAFYWAEGLEFIINKAWKEQYKKYMNLCDKRRTSRNNELCAFPRHCQRSSYQ